MSLPIIAARRGRGGLHADGGRRWSERKRQRRDVVREEEATP
jgi:hypothetical protein